jgi:spore maturation protein CgeB
VRALMVHPGPAFSVHDVYRGWYRGLEQAGIQVVGYELGERLDLYSQADNIEPELAVRLAAEDLRSACYDVWPDVVIVVSGFFIPESTMAILKARPHKLVLIATESPYEDDRQLRVASWFDHVVLNDPTNITMYDGDVWYQPHSYDPAVHHPGPSDRDLACDVSFVGTGYPSRIETLEAVQWGTLDVLLAGNWQNVTEGSPLEPFLLHERGMCFSNEDAADLYRSTTVGLNLYRKEAYEGSHADGWAMGPREVELAACGRMFLREPRPEGDDVFPFLPRFTDPGELTELAHWWAARPDQADELGAKAALAVADRTFHNAALRLLERIGR